MGKLRWDYFQEQSHQYSATRKVSWKGLGTQNIRKQRHKYHNLRYWGCLVNGGHERWCLGKLNIDENLELGIRMTIGTKPVFLGPSDSHALWAQIRQALRKKQHRLFELPSGCKVRCKSILQPAGRTSSQQPGSQTRTQQPASLPIWPS